MKKIITLAALGLLIAAPMSAQTVYDAAKITNKDLNGTARFVGMGLRGYGQHDPVVEYRIEGFAMFDEMIASIREDAVHMLLTIEIRQQNAEPKREQIAKPTGDNAPGDTGAKAPAPVRVTKIGRNDPCPCGSGLKWKKCTCKEYHPDL